MDMKYACYVPPLGDYADARTLANLARDAEQAGWDGFFTWDHMVMGWPDRVVDPWVAYSAIAMNTERIRFGPTVTPLARRRPWKVARETVSLDHLSNGRMVMGVGLGGGESEFDAFGETTGLKNLGQQLDEALAVLTGLWSGEPFHFDGRYYHIQETCFQPVPVQKPRIPIWVGGFWPNQAPFRRAARWDGVFALNSDQESYMTPENVREMLQVVMRYRVSQEPFDVVNTGYTTGTNLDRDAEWVGQYERAGVTWWLEGINPWRFGWELKGPWPTDAMRERILQGPPRL